MGRAQSAIATTPQQRLRPSSGYASEEPGTVATAARRIVATSAGGDRPCRQSCPERRRLSLLLHNNSLLKQFSFMLPLEVMGPGGSLSTELIATPYGRDASWRVSWQAASMTAASSVTGRLRRSSIGWEAPGGGTGGADRFRRQRSLTLFISRVKSAFFSYWYYFVLVLLIGYLFGLY